MAARAKGSDGPVRWQDLKLEYLSDFELSLRELARRHGMHQKTVWERALKEGWATEREELIQQVSSEARQRAVGAMAATAGKNAASLLAQLGKARERILKRLLEDLEAEGGMVTASSEVTSSTTDRKTGATVRRHSVKRRPRVDAPFMAQVLKAESQVLAAVLGIDRRARAADDDETVVVS